MRPQDSNHAVTLAVRPHPPSCRSATSREEPHKSFDPNNKEHGALKNKSWIKNKTQDSFGNGGAGGDRTRVQNTSALNIYEHSLIIFLARKMIDGQIIPPASQVTFNVLATDRSRHAISGRLDSPCSLGPEKP